MTSSPPEPPVTVVQVLNRPEVSIVERLMTGPQGPPGPVGPQGPEGQRGPAGASGVGASAFKSFATALLRWEFTHNLGTKALFIDAYDSLGSPITGDISFVDDMTIAIDWYIPVAGSLSVYS